MRISICLWSQLPRWGGWDQWEKLPKSVMIMWSPCLATDRNQRDEKQMGPSPWERGTAGGRGKVSKGKKEGRGAPAPGEKLPILCRLPPQNACVSGSNCGTWAPAFSLGWFQEKQTNSNALQRNRSWIIRIYTQNEKWREDLWIFTSCRTACRMNQATLSLSPRRHVFRHSRFLYALTHLVTWEILLTCLGLRFLNNKIRK